MVPAPPTLDDGELAAELSRLRRAGITKIRQTPLPMLEVVSKYLLGGSEPSQVEQLVQHAVTNLQGGQFGKAAALMFGVAPTTRGMKPTELRAMAADVFGVLPGTFRREREQQIIEAMVVQLRGLVVRQRVQPASDGVDDRAAHLQRLVDEVAELTAAELGQFVPMLAARLSVPQDQVWK